MVTAIVLLSRYSSSDVMVAGHSNNWAVLACTSRYWFNYRHVSNTLSMYYIIRKMGIPDNQIILMNAMDPSCDTRNPFPGDIFNTLGMDTVLNEMRRLDLAEGTPPYDRDNYGVEIDYRGDEVSVDSFMRVLTGRHKTGTTPSKILQSGNDSNVLIFLSGHGGDEFLKFRDIEEISAHDLGYAFKEMHLKKRYKEILMIVDTCQASTLATRISSPNIISIGSSGKGENSYAYEPVDVLGISVIDRFSFMVNNFFHRNAGIPAGNVRDNPLGIKSNRDLKSSGLTLQNLLDYMDYRILFSTVSIFRSEGSRDPKNILLTEFFSQPIFPMKAWSQNIDSASVEEQPDISGENWGNDWLLDEVYEPESESQPSMICGVESEEISMPTSTSYNCLNKAIKEKNSGVYKKYENYEVVMIAFLFLTLCACAWIFDCL